jgi:DNA-binding Lrp family transcriptional regulator
MISPDTMDRAIINRLQGGFPVCERPYAAVADELGMPEDELLQRLSVLLENGVLTRFGPLFNAERMGGAYSLCAVAAPEKDKPRVIEVINALPETAHHYERDHVYNLWFVLGAADAARIDAAAAHIEDCTGLPVLNLPKQREFFLHLQLKA